MQILRQFWQTVKRFPFVMGACLLFVVLFMYSLENADKAESLINCFLVILLAIPVFVAITLFCESRSIKFHYQLISNLVAIVIFVGVYFLMPENIFLDKYSYIFLPIGTVLWTLPFLAAFFDRRKHDDFLEFTYNVVFYGLIYYILAGLIMIGLSIAVFAIYTLFELGFFVPKVLSYFGSVVFGLGLPLMILNNVHKKLANIEQPKLHKINIKSVAKYLLFPLVVIYFLIIYSYALKIIFTATWPEGIVGTMVLAFVGLALFTMFFSWTHYAKTKARHFFTGIFIAIIPMAILLLFAVGVRVSEYGVTESRYFVTLSGLIFIAISTYYLISRTRFNWKYVLIGCSIIAIVTTFGPWSAINVARNSQFDRLIDRLDDLGLYENNKFIKADEPIYFSYDKDDHIQYIIRDINYLQRQYGSDRLNELFDTDITEFKTGSYIAKEQLNIMYKYAR